MSGLVWEQTGDHIWFAWSGQLCVGTATEVSGGLWWFDATYLVRMRDLPGAALAHGNVTTLEKAKAALELAWTTWLQVAALQPLQGGSK